jgi:hypothetical protein
MIDEDYVRQLEKNIEILSQRLERSEKLVAAGYDICIFDDRLSLISSQKVLDYLVSFGWELQQKKKVDEQKRRWEFLKHPTGLQSSIVFTEYEKTSLGKEFVYDVDMKRAVFQFPYKPIGMKYTQKYGMETIEAYNKLNIVLKKQAQLENKPLMQLVDEFLTNFRE